MIHQPRRGLGRGLLLLVFLWAGPWAHPVAAAEDGRVAFLRHTDGYWQAWVMAADGGRARQLTDSPVDKTRVDWFPNGAALMVSAQQGPPRRVDLAGGPPVLVDIPFDETSDAVVSPSGAEIAVSYSPAGSRDDHEIFVVPLGGNGEPRRMTNAPHVQHEPAWDPSNAWIYFLSREAMVGHHIWRVAPDGTRREALTAGEAYHFDVTIGPLGSIAFSTNRSGNFEVWAGESVSKARPLTDHPALDAGPSFSPDEREIVFESSRSGQPEIWKIRIPSDPGAGSIPEQLTETPRGARRPAWWWPRSVGEGP
ncbi:MAG: hypothetical protein GY937_05780 [bacterium]|nr:hypothetical protein [bacterium]